MIRAILPLTAALALATTAATAHTRQPHARLTHNAPAGGDAAVQVGIDSYAGEWSPSQQNFDNTAPPSHGADAVAVPEPSTIVIGLMALCGVSATMMRRRLG